MKNQARPKGKNSASAAYPVLASAGGGETSSDDSDSSPVPWPRSALRVAGRGTLATGGTAAASAAAASPPDSVSRTDSLGSDMDTSEPALTARSMGSSVADRHAEDAHHDEQQTRGEAGAAGGAGAPPAQRQKLVRGRDTLAFGRDESERIEVTDKLLELMEEWKPIISRDGAAAASLGADKVFTAGADNAISTSDLTVDYDAWLHLCHRHGATAIGKHRGDISKTVPFGDGPTGKGGIGEELFADWEMFKNVPSFEALAAVTRALDNKYKHLVHFWPTFKKNWLEQPVTRAHTNLAPGVNQLLGASGCDQNSIEGANDAIKRCVRSRRAAHNPHARPFPRPPGPTRPPLLTTARTAPAGTLCVREPRAPSTWGIPSSTWKPCRSAISSTR